MATLKLLKSFWYFNHVIANFSVVFPNDTTHILPGNPDLVLQTVPLLSILANVEHLSVLAHSQAIIF